MLQVILQHFPSAHASLIQAEPPYLDSTEAFNAFIDSKMRMHTLIFTTLDEYNFDSFQSISKKYLIYSLFKESLYLEVAKDHPVASKKSVPIKAITNLPLFAFGVNNDTTPFCFGALERRYNVKLRPTIISNTITDFQNSPFLKQCVLLRGAHGWQENNLTTLVPLQEKFSMHHAMLLPNIEPYTYINTTIILPYIGKQFPNLYRIE